MKRGLAGAALESGGVVGVSEVRSGGVNGARFEAPAEALLPPATAPGGVNEVER